MTATEKLNWKSVWLAICAISCVCRGIMKLQRRKDSISGADKMNSDTFLLGTLWFLLLLLLEGSASAATVWLSFLSLSLPPPLQCLPKNINKTPWRGCQQDASQGGDTWGEREQRQEAGGWREKKSGGVLYINPKNVWGKAGVEWGVIYLVFHAESTFTTSLFFCGGCWMFNRTSCRCWWRGPPVPDPLLYHEWNS